MTVLVLERVDGSICSVLDPHNPTVFNDCFSLGSGWFERDELLGLIEELKQEFRSDEFVQANCDFYTSGNLLIQDHPRLAKRKFMSAQKEFRHILPRKHQVFKALRIALKQCS